MKVGINIKELLFNIYSVSHTEVANIENPVFRYNVEAGTEKEEMLRVFIDEGIAEITSNFERFLFEQQDTVGDNSFEDKVSYIFNFRIADRRQSGSADVIARKINAVLTNYVLAKHYISVAYMDLAKIHSDQLLVEMKQLEREVFTKRPTKPLNYTLTYKQYRDTDNG